MTLYEFVETFISHNSMVRLVRKTTMGHEVVIGTWEKVFMNWEVLKKVEGIVPFLDSKVVGITSIDTRGQHTEAINIVIE